MMCEKPTAWCHGALHIPKPKGTFLHFKIAFSMSERTSFFRRALQRPQRPNNSLSKQVGGGGVQGSIDRLCGRAGCPGLPLRFTHTKFACAKKSLPELITTAHAFAPFHPKRQQQLASTYDRTQSRPHTPIERQADFAIEWCCSIRPRSV